MLLIQKYFSNLTDIQLKQFEALQGLYEDWNSKINVISRKDIEALYLRHVLHSLSIAKLIQFQAGCQNFRYWYRRWVSWTSFSDFISRC